MRLALLSGLAVVMWTAAVSAAQAAPSCVHRGDRVVASGPQLMMLQPISRTAAALDARIVCLRKTGKRRTLSRGYAVCSHCGFVISNETLRARFAYAVVTTNAYDSY